MSFRRNRSVVYASPIQLETKNQNDKEQSCGCEYDAITDRLTHNYSTSWGPRGFKKMNHPLAIMVRLLYTILSVCPSVCYVSSLIDYTEKKQAKWVAKQLDS